MAISLRRQLLARAFQLTHNRCDAEDLVQDVYLALVRRPPRPRTPAALHSWLRTVLKNRQIDRWRKIEREDADPLDYRPASLESVDFAQFWG